MLRRSARRSPAIFAAPPRPGPDGPRGVGARQIHLALLGILVANEPGLRANLDTEFLHDFRVAVRRTRSLLGQIRHVFPPTPSSTSRPSSRGWGASRARRATWTCSFSR